MNSPMLTTFDVAIMLGVRMRDVWLLVSKGQLRASIVEGVYRFREADVRWYVDQRDAVRRVVAAA